MALVEDRVSSTTAYYDECAEQYASAALARCSDTLIGDFLHSLPEGGALVADLGCGPGRDLRNLESRAFQGIGLDRSREMIATARSHTQSPLVHGDLTSLPFMTACFDGVICLATLHHLAPAAQGVAISEISRVLKHDAVALISARISPQLTEDLSPTATCARAFYAMRPEDLRHLAGESGLDVIQQLNERDTSREHISWTRLLLRRDRIT